MSLTVNIIGAGKLGKTFGRIIAESDNTTVQAVLNSRLESSQSAAHFIGQGQAVSTIEELPSADFWLLAAKDDYLTELLNKLIKQNKLTENCVVFHCSGILSSQLLKQEITAHVASLHPMHSFADPAVSAETLKGSLCTIEGTPVATNRLKELLSTFHFNWLEIDVANKALYHASACMASNFLVTLFAVTSDLLQKTGLPADTAKQLLYPLMRDTLENCGDSTSAKQALTGPLQRGDCQTIQRHLEQLAQTPAVDKLYRQLGELTLPLCDHDANMTQKLKQILTAQDT